MLSYGPACSLGEQMSRLLGLVPKARVMPVLLDDVRDDPGRCYREVLRFLDVPDDGRSQFGVVNSAMELRFPRLEFLIHGLYVTRKRLHFPRTYIGLAFSPFKRWNVRPSTRPPLENDMRTELREYFMPDINVLERLLGRSLAAWKGDTPKTLHGGAMPHKSGLKKPARDWQRRRLQG